MTRHSSFRDQPPSNTRHDTRHSTFRDQPSSNTRHDKPRNKTHRIQLRYIDSSKKTKKEEVFETAFRELQAPLTKLTETQSGFYATTDDQQAIDKLTTARATDLFKKINLKPVEPPELRSKKTIFVRQVDSSAGDRPAEEIKQELQEKHQWLKVKEVIKIKQYTHVFKIVCTETQMASKILETGLSIFNTRIPPYNCEMEEFTHLLICYRCYQIENHPTSECKSPTTVCSECSQQGHMWTDCTSETKRCLNCPQENNFHRTLAAKCPKRKEAIARKKQQEQQQEQQKKTATYSEIVKETVKQTNIQKQEPIQNLTLTSNLQVKLTALIIEAHIASLTGTGKYGQILSNSLRENFSIDAKFPDRDSQAIFRTFINNNQINEEQNMEIPTTDDQYIDDDDLETSMNLSAHHRTPIKNRYALLEPEIQPVIEDYNDTIFNEPQRIQSPQKSPIKKNKSPVKKINEHRQQEPRTITIENHPLAASKAMGHSTIQMKRKAPDQGQFDVEYEIAIFKSALDPETTPQKITEKYIWESLHRKDMYGLKMSVDKGDPDKVMDRLRKGGARLYNANVMRVPHEEFILLPRIPKQQQKKVRHSSLGRI